MFHPVRFFVRPGPLVKDDRQAGRFQALGQFGRARSQAVLVDEAAEVGRLAGTLPPVILVFPRRPDDSITPRPDGDLPYEHFIVAELIPWVESHTPARTDRAGRAIGGISRGGFWALEIAFHHPELFEAVGGHNRPYWRSHAADYLAFYAAPWLTTGTD